MSEATTTEEQSTKKKRKKEEKTEMSFLDHLEALRWHIIRAVLSVIVFSIVAFINKDFIFDSIIFAPKSPQFWSNRMLAKLADLVDIPSLKINTHPLQLISIDISGQFMTHVWTSIKFGFIAASPKVIYQLWSFIKPALYENERMHASGAVLVMSALFLTGTLFGYYLIVPFSIVFLGSYSICSTVVNQINILSYISTVTSIVIAGGVVFELPVLAFFLSKIGVITPRFLKKFRRHSYVVLLVVSAIITPPDIFSQISVCIPLVFLYEASILISARVEKARLRKLDEI
jgi:sec-independent protein translocase protein TatC